MHIILESQLNLVSPCSETTSKVPTRAFDRARASLDGDARRAMAIARFTRSHAFAFALASALVLSQCVRSIDGFYLPGVAPQDYERDDLVYIKVNKLTSTVTQLPYDYYSLPYCKPAKVKHAAENLGEVLRGDRIENSLYALEMRFDDQCKLQCKQVMTAEDAKLWKARIVDEYRVQMCVRAMRAREALGFGR